MYETNFYFKLIVLLVGHYFQVYRQCLEPYWPSCIVCHFSGCSSAWTLSLISLWRKFTNSFWWDRIISIHISACFILPRFQLLMLLLVYRAIEVITSSKRIILKEDPYTGEFVQTKVNVWNPTVANLTLMALGSSAPEILLNVIETV